MASLNGADLIGVGNRARRLSQVRFSNLSSKVSEQRSHAELNVDFDHQEDEGDSEEVRDVDGEARDASANGEKDENCVEHKVRNEAARLELKISLSSQDLKPREKAQQLPR